MGHDGAFAEALRASLSSENVLAPDSRRIVRTHSRSVFRVNRKGAGG